MCPDQETPVDQQPMSFAGRANPCACLLRCTPDAMRLLVGTGSVLPLAYTSNASTPAWAQGSWTGKACETAHPLPHLLQQGPDNPTRVHQKESMHMKCNHAFKWYQNTQTRTPKSCKSDSAHTFCSMLACAQVHGLHGVGALCKYRVCNLAVA